MTPQPKSGIKMVTYITIESEREGQRIDNFLITHLKGVPKSRIYRILRKGEVRVNKKRIKPVYRLQAGDVLRIPPVRCAEQVVATYDPSKSSFNLLDTILYEDDKLFIINKPCGLAVHGGSGVSLGAIEMLRQLRPDDKHLELIHRLDRATSGCLMIAKTRAILREVHALLREGKVNKTYSALVAGIWPKGLQTVDAPLSKNVIKSGERVAVVDHEDGKAAQTYFRRVEQYDDATLLDVKPRTGRMHQIRVHTAEAGHPIVGDEKYGDDAVNRQFKGKGCSRLCLHARALSFILPTSGQQIDVEAPMDKDFFKAQS